MLKAVLPFTARVFARAIVMPNLDPPVTTAAAAAAYAKRIKRALPKGAKFTPLMTAYLTDATDPAELERGFKDGIWVAAKLYPAHATTGAGYGVTDIARIQKPLERLQKIGMPLLVHGEVTDPGVDIFDREAVFIERVLSPLVKRLPGLKLVFEHATTREAVDFVLSAGPNVAATITPHHLTISRNAMFQGGLRPHMYCLPVAKRAAHRQVLRHAATSGSPKFFLGTDSAPHPVRLKESDCGCAGIFNAPTALETYATVFEAERSLDQLEAFASLNGPRFYGLPPNSERISLTRKPWKVPAKVAVGKDTVKPFFAGEEMEWKVAG